MATLYLGPTGAPRGNNDDGATAGDSGMGPAGSTLYRDCAANERTFLAWMRTAIALMAFGFVVERFGDDGAALAALASASVGDPPIGGSWSNAGLALTALGIVVAVSSYYRFRRLDLAIRSREPARPGGGATEILLTLGLVAMGALLAVGVGHLVSW